MLTNKNKRSGIECYLVGNPTLRDGAGAQVRGGEGERCLFTPALMAAAAAAAWAADETGCCEIAVEAPKSYRHKMFRTT